MRTKNLASERTQGIVIDATADSAYVLLGNETEAQARFADGVSARMGDVVVVEVDSGHPTEVSIPTEHEVA